MHFIFYSAWHMRENYFIFNDSDDGDDDVDDGTAELKVTDPD